MKVLSKLHFLSLAAAAIAGSVNSNLDFHFTNKTYPISNSSAPIHDEDCDLPVEITKTETETTTAIETKTTTDIETTVQTTTAYETVTQTLFSSIYEHPLIPDDDGDEQDSDEPIHSMPPPPPAQSLAPVVHWNVDLYDKNNLHPVDYGFLYYSSKSTNSPNANHTFGTLNYTYNYPSVNLDHSGFCSVSYSGDSTDGSLSVDFNDDSAYKKAVNEWNCNKGLIFVTYLEGCGSYDSQDTCFFNSSSIKFDDDNQIVTIGGKPCDVKDLASSVDFAWGEYTIDDDSQGASGFGKEDSSSDAFAAATTASGYFAPTAATSLSASTASSSDTCGTYDPVYGFLMGTLGNEFDAGIDDCLGYETIEDTEYYSYLDDLGVDDLDADYEYKEELDSEVINDDDYLDYYDEDEETLLKKRSHLGKRGLFTKVKTKIKKALANGKQLAKQVVSDLKNIKTIIVNKVAKATSISGTLFDKQMTIQVPAKQKVVESPWGNAVLLKSIKPKKNKKGEDNAISAELKFFCVDCGAKGSASIKGSGTFSFALIKFTAGTVAADMNLAVGLQLGIEAKIEYENSFEVSFAKIGLPGLSYGVLTLGPMITVGAEVTFSAAATGTVLGGGKFVISNAKAVVDLVDSSKSYASGWTPNFVPVFNATGEIELKVGAGLPVGLAFGISVGSYSLDVALVDKPSVEFSAKVSGEINLEGANMTSSDSCTGIATAINFKNEVYAKFGKAKQYQLVTPFEKTLKEGCLFGKKEATSSSSSISAAATPVKKRSLKRRDDNSTYDDTTEIYNADAKNVTDWDLPVASNDGYNVTTGYEYITLLDYFLNYQVVSCANGNLYLQNNTNYKESNQEDCSSLWGVTDDSVAVDGFSRILHYYNDTMNKAGISRLRASDQDNIPNGSVYVSLTPYDDEDDETNDIYYAIDDSDNVYFPVACSFTNTSLPAKLFLVANETEGVELLESNKFIYTITGGEIDTCVFLPVVRDPEESGDEWYDTFDEYFDYEDEVYSE
ncbi:uncharacterized protein ASCRUDRAFT_68758 [Ascoidea rubescens DSM 1968]|uniref:Uncharacterized protein n=1 Tax=Ascoidea rubescens DSM 1968 TaxID=1344418 RepID=A0A1D2VMX7_9ASCO|nr:hypothetical protein ASCRUDRAFT_68758 [Ascoidea rubescens DSM 1968]ODV62963.1 hypothetical protein ASCRUDRAFT_68758 [Ascoidea rubescens DSM 1968]